MTKTKCNQKICDNIAIYKVYWPGRETLFMCAPCKNKALGIAEAMGFFLKVELLEESNVKELKNILNEMGK